MRIKLVLCIGVIFLFSSISALAALDLACGPIQGPEWVTEGDIVTYSTSFIAMGSSVNNLKIRGTVGNKIVFEKTYGVIAADTWTPVSFTWTAELIKEPGMDSIYVQLRLDPDGTAGDPDFENNITEMLIHVVEKPVKKPDLNLNITYSPAKFMTGDSVKFLIRVVNLGYATANPSKLHIKHGESLIADINVFPLKSGASTEITHFWNAKCDETITIIADAMNQNKESNENNNTWSQKMVCWKRPINTKYEHYKRLH